MLVLAKKCYLGLAEKYPDSIPNYCEGLVELIGGQLEDFPSDDEFFESET